MREFIFKRLRFVGPGWALLSGYAQTFYAGPFWVQALCGVNFAMSMASMAVMRRRSNASPWTSANDGRLASEPVDPAKQEKQE
jgi:hypothetical protein